MRRALGRLLVLFVLLAALPTSLRAADRRVPAKMKAGVVTRTFTPTERRNWRGDSDHTLRVTIWYPAAESAVETEQTIGPPGLPLFVAGQAVPHAAFAPSLEPFPLVLLSHGTGGSAGQMAWLGTRLARAGFVAAAVDHPGNNSNSGVKPEGFLLPWERATDLSEMLDGLLADPEIGPHLDKGRVGAAGFSLGGYTVLELAGAQTDISLLTDLCRKEPNNPNCSAPEMKGMPSPLQMYDAVRRTSGESLARSADSFRDPRVRAVFAIAPALGFTQTPESLHAIRIPVEIVVGSADSLAPPAQNATFLRANIRGARETILPGVAHYTFLDTCTAAGKAALPVYCTDQSGVEREALHQQVAELAATFFLRTLR